MSALLLSLVLATSPAAPTTPSAPEEARRYAVWLQPVGTAAFGLATNVRFLYLPIGANLPLTEKVGLGLELTYVSGPMSPDGTFFNDSTGTFWRVLASAGPVLSPGGKHLAGFFLQPKLLANVAHETDYASSSTPHQGGTSVALQVGLDIGWHYTVGPLYLAPVLGASFGYGFNHSVSPGAPLQPLRLLSPNFGAYSPQRGSGPSFSINVNLLRMGLTF